MSIGLVDLIAGVFKPAADLVDALHTSTEEKLMAKAHLLDAKAAAIETVLDYEKEVIASKAKIIHAEASSEHWVTATWRPLTMLAIVGMIGARFMGYDSAVMSQAEYESMWDLVTVGLGGYIAARTGEKIVREVKRSA